MAANIITINDLDQFDANMGQLEMLDWLSSKLNRPAESDDVLQAAKEFYQLGAYSRALLCLQYYNSSPAAKIVGKHIMAYCLLNLGYGDKALANFKDCVIEGMHDDWQLVVELTIEQDALSKVKV